MTKITEEELAQWEARLKDGEELPRTVALGLILTVRELQAANERIEKRYYESERQLGNEVVAHTALREALYNLLPDWMKQQQARLLMANEIEASAAREAGRGE